MVSAVVVCLNEEEKLNKCLKSIENFADEMVVVDLGSSDKSLEVAKKFKAKIYSHEFVPYVEVVRDYAISKASLDWILVLDPDEIIPKGLKERLRMVARGNQFVAVNIPRKNIFFGRWIAHTNFWPDRHVRFFKRGKVKWTERIHVYPKVNGRIVNLPAKENLAIIHYGYDTIGQFIDRQNRYSQVEAKNLYDLGERFSWGKFFWRPTRQFLVRLIKHGGFLDGFYGFALTFLMMLYELQVMVKLWELEKEK